MRNLKIIRQTIFNNNDGKAVYAKQVYDIDADEMQSEINKKLRAAVSSISEDISDILDKLDTVIANDATMTNTINDISGKVIALDTKVVALDTKVTAITTKLNTMDSKLDDILTALNTTE